MKKLKLFACCFLIAMAARSQNSPAIKEYVERFKEIAIEEMIRTGVPASIKLAQGIHETEAGRSKLCMKSNNHFGIKCKSEWKGEWVSHDDDARGECFRKYPDPADSYRDHSDFLKNRSHYASLFKLDPLDFEAWAHGLKKAGYATNPKYPQLIIRLIKDYDLQQYTVAALQRTGDAPPQILELKEVKVSEVSQDGSTYLGVPPSVEPRIVYPAGKFVINETPVIFAEEGTSFLSIANKYNIPLARLFEYNDRKAAEVVEVDQLVFLQKKKNKGETPFHIVAEGETLHRIAQAEGIRLQNLADYNDLTINSEVKVGDRLYLQKEAPLSDVKGSYFIHTVREKETMFAISKRYGVTIDNIIKWNELEGTELRKGQQLKIVR